MSQRTDFKGSQTGRYWIILDGLGRVKALYLICLNVDAIARLMKTFISKVPLEAKSMAVVYQPPLATIPNIYQIPKSLGS